MSTLDERFWAKVNKDGPVLRPELGACWVRSSGTISIGGRKGITAIASRVAWFLETGKWPELDVCHKCDNPPCVRFSHLFEGTHGDNMADMVSKGRSRAPKGVLNGNSKITEAIVRSIREALAMGVSQGKAAQLHEVSKRTVWDIKEGRTWSHIGETQ